MKASKKINVPLLLLILAACNKSDFYAIPEPAKLEYGQPSAMADGVGILSAAEGWKPLSKMEMGRRPFGSTSVTPIWVKNNGDLPANVSKVWMNDEQSNIFSVTSDCGEAIPRGATCLVQVKYKPDTVGETPTGLNLAYDNGEGKVEQLSIPVMATASNLAFLSFEQELVEIQSTTINYSLNGTFNVRYNGSALTAKGLSIEPAKGVVISDPTDGSFTIDREGTTCGDVIEADCIVKVKFKPVAVGAASAGFSLNYFNGAEVLKIGAKTEAAGLKAEVAAKLTAAAADFGQLVANPQAGRNVVIPVTFASGSVPAQKVTIEDPKTTSFEIIDDAKTTCKPSMIDGNCDLHVKFYPTKSGTHSDFINIKYESLGLARETLKIDLKGVAAEPALLSVDLLAWNAGDASAFKTISKTFNIRNIGGVAISNLSVITSAPSGLSASFDTKDYPCKDLAPNAANPCRVYGNIKPSVEGALSGTYTFTYFDGRADQRVTISATTKGTSPLRLEANGDINFGDVMIEKIPSKKTVNVTAYGLATLTNAAQLPFTQALKAPFTTTFGSSTSSFKAPIDPKKGKPTTTNFDVSVTDNKTYPANIEVLQKMSVGYTADGGNGSGVLNFTVRMTPRNPPVLAYNAIAAFKKLSVDDSAEMLITLKNNSAYFPTTFVSYSISGDSSFSIVPLTDAEEIKKDCKNGVAKNSTCNLRVKFKPEDAGNFTGKIVYVYNDGLKNQTIEGAISGEGSPDVTLAADKSEVNFKEVFVGDNIPDQIVNLKYFGASDWTHTSTAAAPFKITPEGCGVESGCKLRISFKPTVAGTFSAPVIFGYEKALTSPGKINLTFKGVAKMRVPALSVTPVVMPKILVGQTANQVLTVKNNGNTPAQDIVFGALTGAIRFADNGAPGSAGNCALSQTLDENQSCTLKVTFEPTVVGKVEAKLSLNYQSAQGGTPSSETVTLSGVGTQMIKAFAGAFQTCIINEVGAAVCWGRNSSGQLGVGNASAQTKTPKAMAAINFGANVKVRKLAVGDAHTCALVDEASSTGSVVCWGSNANGRLGLGKTVASTTSPLDSSGKLNAINFGLDASSDKEEAVDIAAGFEHSCALLKSGNMKCWGGNSSGQLGIDSNQSVGTTLASVGDSMKTVNMGGRNIASVNGIKGISAGAGHSCAILENGASMCWGDNFYGQLGQGNDEEKIGNQSSDMSSLAPINFGKGFEANQIQASSGAFTCALSTSGDVKCFGKTVADESSSQPFFGVLGSCWARQLQNTTAVSCASNTSMNPTNALGYLASDMGDRLTKVDLGSLKAEQLSLGSSFSCALMSDKSVKCWGSNDNGQLGIGSRLPIGAGAQDMGANLKTAIGAGLAVQVVTGYEHSCAVLTDNTMKCWGAGVENVTGLLSLGVSGSTGVSAATIPQKLAIVYDGNK